MSRGRQRGRAGHSLESHAPGLRTKPISSTQGLGESSREKFQIPQAFPDEGELVLHSGGGYF